MMIDPTVVYPSETLERLRDGPWPALRKPFVSMLAGKQTHTRRRVRARPTAERKRGTTKERPAPIKQGRSRQVAGLTPTEKLGPTATTTGECRPALVVAGENLADRYFQAWIGPGVRASLISGQPEPML